MGSSMGLLAKSSSMVACWLTSSNQLPGLPVAFIAAPRQSSTSSFSSQESSSQPDGRQANPDYIPPEQPTSVPMEDLIRSQLDQQSNVQIPQFFYLKHRYAGEVVGVLSSYFGISGGDDGGLGGGLVGGVLENVVGGGTGDLFDSFLGGPEGEGSSSSLEGDVRFGTDSHFNSLYVIGATETDLLLINDLIDHLDQPNAPQNPELLGQFRTIAIVHRDPEEVKELVEAQLSELIARRRRRRCDNRTPACSAGR